MGGLRIPLTELSEMISFEDMDNRDRQRLVKVAADDRLNASLIITTAGILELTKSDHWIYTTEAAIDDKSKANPVQKSLILLQVLWMATQCISRTSYGLPLTLLELHTMVHVVCAVTLYFFWFRVSERFHTMMQNPYKARLRAGRHAKSGLEAS